MFNENNKSPLVITNYDSLMLQIKRFLYRRNGTDYIYEGGFIALENNKLNYVYIETPFNLIKKSVIDYPANAVKIGKFLTSNGNIVFELRDDVDLIASDDSGGGSGTAEKLRLVFSLWNRNQKINRWLQYNNLTTNLQGVYLWNTGKLDAVFIKTNNLCDCNFYIYKNVNSESASQPANIPLLIVNMASEDFKYVPNINIDLYAGDYLKIYLEILSGKVSLPTLNIDIKNN